MTKTPNTRIADGLRAAESAPEAPALNLALSIVTDSDLTGAATALTQATDKFAKQLDSLNASIEAERGKLMASASRMFEHQDQAKRHTETALTKYQREQLAANADGFREVLRAAKQWHDRAEVSLKVCPSPSALLTQQSGIDAGPEFANLLSIARTWGFSAFQAATAKALQQRDARLAAVLCTVLNESKAKRDQMNSAGISVASISEAIAGESWRKRTAALKKVINDYKLMEETYAAQASFVNGTAANPNRSARVRIEQGLRDSEIAKLTGKPAAKPVVSEPVRHSPPGSFSVGAPAPRNA
jgi:hypothetical protein